MFALYISRIFFSMYLSRSSGDMRSISSCVGGFIALASSILRCWACSIIMRSYFAYSSNYSCKVDFSQTICYCCLNLLPNSKSSGFIYSSACLLWGLFFYSLACMISSIFLSTPLFLLRLFSLLSFPGGGCC